jgi:Flp pilus assembly pilin Flp
MRNKKGQSILEYVIVLTAIIAAIVVAAVTLIKPAVNKISGKSADTIGFAADQLPVR